MEMEKKNISPAAGDRMEVWGDSYSPPPRLTVSEWADKYRILSPESSPEPGKWNTARAEFQRGIMDALSIPGIERIVFMSSSQIGKTEMIINTVGYFIDRDPCPILVVQPTDTMAQTWSKDRLNPMVRDTPPLRGKIKEPRTRDSSNTILHKVFPGGHITRPVWPVDQYVWFCATK
jgi:phage terminase large subunit GpA-like protein